MTNGGGAETYQITSGLTYDTGDLPHAPYENIDGAVVQSMRPCMYDYMIYFCCVHNYDIIRII